MLTGHLLKDPAAVIDRAPAAIEIDASLAALDRALGISMTEHTAADGGGNETILLVDDEPSLRSVAARGKFVRYVLDKRQNG